MGSCMSKSCTRTGDTPSPRSRTAAHRDPTFTEAAGATNPMVIGPSTAATLPTSTTANHHRGDDDVRPFLDDSFEIEDNAELEDLTVVSVGTASPAYHHIHNAVAAAAPTLEQTSDGMPRMQRSNTQAFAQVRGSGDGVGGGAIGPRRRSSSSTTGHSSTGGGNPRASLSVVSFDGAGGEGGGSFRRRRSSATTAADNTTGTLVGGEASNAHVRTSVTSLTGSTSSIGWRFTVRPVSSNALMDVDPSSSANKPPPADPLLLSVKPSKGRGRIRLASSVPLHGSGSGTNTKYRGGGGGGGLLRSNADSPTMSMTSRASSVASFAMRSVVPFDFLESNAMRRDRASEAPRALCDHMFPSLLLTHDDILQSTGQMDSGELCGPVLVVGDCSDDIVAAVMVLSTMETYCVEEHGRLLSTLFAHVIATGSGGFVALSLSQGETMASLLELLLQNDSSLLRKRSGGGAAAEDAGFHSDGVGTIDALMQMRFADQRIEEGQGGGDKSSWAPLSPNTGPRRMCHRYRRGDYYVARPCLVVAERGGSFLRRIDWTSKALVHRLYAVCANCITNVNDTGLALLGDDAEDVCPATDALPDPVLLALKITPRPTAVCRISVARKQSSKANGEDAEDDGEDATATEMMAKAFGSDFVDIGLPTFLSPRTSPTAPALASSKTDRGKSQPHRSSLQSFAGSDTFQSQGPTGVMSSMSTPFGLDVTPLEDLLLQWNLSGVDKQRRVAIMNQTEAFITENEGSLQRAVDYLAVKAAKPHTMTPPECALQLLHGRVV